MIAITECKIEVEGEKENNLPSNFEDILEKYAQLVHIIEFDSMEFCKWLAHDRCMWAVKENDWEAFSSYIDEDYHKKLKAV